MDGLFHPFIQVGYGLEFDSKALTAMALAQSCVHRKFYQTLLDESTVADICSGTPINDGPGLSLMQILRAAREDPLAAATVFSEQPFLRTGADHVEKLSAKYANAWDVPATKDAIAAKHAELLSTLALLYGSLTRPGYAPLLHFIVMHSLTSAYFLPIFFDHLSLERQAALLKVHWALDLSVFLLLGAPALHVPPELVSTDTHGVKTGAWASDTNGWLEVFKKAIDSQDSHIPKVIRSLWRGSLLGSFGSQAGSDDGYELPPAINWLYLARRTIDVVTLSSFEEPGPQIEAGRRFWAFGMVGFDEFWATYPRE
ncbi:hypothetical protein H4R21_003869 [Coemansia helicoidea]|nr:hypothetical protein H4R21_003869 [Coemansia helicoidea]